MNTTLNSKTAQEINCQILIPLYIFVIIFGLILYGFDFPVYNSNAEIPAIQHLIDPDLYPKDFYVQETSQFGPRYYYQQLIFLSTKIGLSIPLSHFFYYVLAFASFLLGLYALGKKFGGSILSGGILAFLSFMVSQGIGTVGYTSLFKSEALSSIFAMGLSIWGIYFCFSQKWIRGYLFFGLACLLQFLVGSLPAVLFIPVLLVYSYKKRELKSLIFSLLILSIFISLVYVPMILLGTTNSEKLSDSEFVYWYAYLRLPHHILMSSFSREDWRNFIALMIGGIACISHAKLLSKDEKLNFLLIILGTFIALAIGYIFVEVYPSATIAKLQLARTTPFAVLMVLIVISTVFMQYYQQKNWTICSLLIIPLLIKNGIILFCLIALGLAFSELNQRFSTLVSRLASRYVFVVTLLGLLSILALKPAPVRVAEPFTLNQTFYKVLWFGILLLPYIVEMEDFSDAKARLILWGMAIFSVMYFFLGFLGFLPASLPKITWPQLPSDPLAEEFRNLSPKDSLILVPPNLEDFRLQAQRSIVFDFRHFPFTDKGILEWSHRFKILVGHFNNNGVWWNNRNIIDEKYSNFSEAELVRVAKNFKANYILTRSDWHPNLSGTLVAQKGQWVIYKID